MILVDTNNKPQNTIYYIAGVSYGYLRGNPGLSFSELLDSVSRELLHRKVEFHFFVLAIDFLFLIGKIVLDAEGGLHAAA